MRSKLNHFYPTLLCLLLFGTASAQTPSENEFGQESGKRVYIFRFEPANDMFYLPYSGNDGALNNLYLLVDEYREEITSGQVVIHVDGYCASSENAKENLKIAAVRSNRVKSELIANKGLTERHFATRNHTSAYPAPGGRFYRDVVVINISITERTKISIPEPKIVIVEQEEEPAVVEEVEPTPPVVEEVIPEPAAPTKPYCIALRTNLLYNAFLMPTLGIEWRISRNVGIKVDGSFAHWGDTKGSIQKMWFVSPEVRWYMGKAKRFYLGAGAHIGEANVYEYPVGKILQNLFTDDLGYQGDFWNAGITLGYQLRLSRALSMDFNLGLGYTRFEYDTFTVVNETRISKSRDITKDLWGPTQAGVSLVWELGTKK